MNEIPNFKDERFYNALLTLWNYMHINESPKKADLIIGCGCTNLDIPIRCAQLIKEGYADKVLFTGGLGRISKHQFQRSEAEIFRDIAIQHGVDPKAIYLETKSTNTGDNFRYSLNIIKENNLKINKVIIVHTPITERRTLYTAKNFLKDSELYITSPTNISTLDSYCEYLMNNPHKIEDSISSLVGDIQRIIIYPQFGWLIACEVPAAVIDSYYYMKSLGYDKFIFTKEQIQEQINKYGLVPNQKPNYFN